MRTRRFALFLPVLLLMACGEESPEPDDAGSRPDASTTARDAAPSDAAPSDAAPSDASAGDAGPTDAGPALPPWLCPSGTLPDGTPCPELAFPTARGFGRFARGGRGGEVLHVTTLDDDGEGSLRRALERSGPRIVVFDVGGTITLERPISIEEPFLTVAGQTAPGDGILVRGGGILVRTSDVIIRHLRVRPGDGAGETDAISIYGFRDASHRLRDIILDHVSVSWGTDGLIDLWARDSDAGDITIQRSLLAETLHDSVHPEGTHSRALLVGSGVERVSIVDNLLAHNNRRHPHFSSGAADVDVVNNVVYDWGQIGIHYASGSATRPFTGINVVNNYFRKGAESRDDPLYEEWYFAVAPGSTVHIGGNLVDRPDAVVTAEENSECFDDPGCASDYRGSSCTGFCLSETPTRPLEGVEPVPADEVWARMLADVGATVPVRDAVDQRVVQEARDRTGSLVNCVEPDGSARCMRNGGGWPTIAPGTPPADGDRDGMPDAWETRHGLDAADGSDGADYDLSAIYTNVEVYLNELAGD
jgi:hypothetical protein